MSIEIHWRGRGSRLWRLLSSLLLLVGLAEPALAIPAFARRYRLPCQYCHDGYPKLSPLGEQFKERGFRMERETFAVKEWLKSVPVVLRAGLNQTFVEEGEANTTGFFKVVSAGNLGRRVSYWVDQQFSATEDGFDRLGADNAYLRVEIVPDKLYLRGGRLELDLPFSQIRSPHLLAYNVYFANTGFESDTIALNQEGGELGGFVGSELRWSVAVVRGRNAFEAESLSDRAGRFDANLYGRAAWREGQNRVGAFGYLGRNVLARVDQGRVLEWEDGLLRLGFDGYAWLSKLNLYGVFLYGRNDNSFADSRRPNGTNEAQSFSGGFLQADYHLRDEVAPTLRLNLVRQPTNPAGGSELTSVGIVPGVQIWFKRQIKISFEVGFFNKGRPTLGAFQVEFGV
jgi:hypothetical protein